MAYTKFIANLPCSNCGQTNRAFILSRLDDEGRSYQVGDRTEDRITISDFDVACLTVRPPADGVAPPPARVAQEPKRGSDDVDRR